MRIPYIINRNVFDTYQPSDVTLSLLLERGRLLQAEKFGATIVCPDSLVQQCLNVLAKHFNDFPVINDLVLCADRDYMLEILGTDLPLSLVVPLIEDEIYWKRRFTDKYGVLSQHLHKNWTWKCIYLENHMGELVEKAQPELNDEENMTDITTLLNPYVHRLVVNQLQSWKPPLMLEKDEIPDVYPSDHINLQPIFNCLANIEELEIKYGVKSVGENFTWNMFKLSLDDARHLGKALLELKKLRLLCIHTSDIQDSHMQLLAKELIKVVSLQELSITSCLIGNRGALCIAKIMMTHPALSKLVLSNNQIGGIGGEGLGYALMQETCCPLKHLDLKLNPLGHKGVMGIFRALVRVHIVEELILAGVGFEDETSLRLGTVLQLHYNLKYLDVSNNWCKPGEEQILNGMELNNTLQWFDLRETDVSPRILVKIKRKLRHNRRNEDEESDAGSAESLEVEETENKVTFYDHFVAAAASDDEEEQEGGSDDILADD